MKYENSKHHRSLSSQPGRRELAIQTADEYLRERDLPQLIAVWPGEIVDPSEAGAIFLIRKLKKALRAERQRGRSGHWSYNLGRHIGLAKALKSEMAVFALGQEQKGGSAKPHTAIDNSLEFLEGS